MLPAWEEVATWSIVSTISLREEALLLFSIPQKSVCYPQPSHSKGITTTPQSQVVDSANKHSGQVQGMRLVHSPTLLYTLPIVNASWMGRVTHILRPHRHAGKRSSSFVLASLRRKAKYLSVHLSANHAIPSDSSPKTLNPQFRTVQNKHSSSSMRETKTLHFPTHSLS